MKKYLLDTNICVFLLRGKYDVDKAIDAVGLSNCAISEITYLELLCGVELALHKSGIDHSEQLKRFANNIVIIPISPSIKTFAKEKIRLRLAGTPQEDNFDLLIGCTAIDNDMVLVTENIKDFKYLQGIHIENWINR